MWCRSTVAWRRQQGDSLDERIQPADARGLLHRRRHRRHVHRRRDRRARRRDLVGQSVEHAARLLDRLLSGDRRRRPRASGSARHELLARGRPRSRTARRSVSTRWSPAPCRPPRSSPRRVTATPSGPWPGRAACWGRRSKSCSTISRAASRHRWCRVGRSSRSPSVSITRGAVVVAISDDDLHRAIDQFDSLGIEAVAISFLWGFVNPAHEQHAARIVRARCPSLFVSCSHEVAPRIGEYGRGHRDDDERAARPADGALHRPHRRRRARTRASPARCSSAKSKAVSCPASIAKQFPIMTVQSGPGRRCRRLGARRRADGLPQHRRRRHGRHHTRRRDHRRLTRRVPRRERARAPAGLRAQGRRRIDRRRRRQHRVDQPDDQSLARRARRARARRRARSVTGAVAPRSRSPMPISCSAS